MIGKLRRMACLRCSRSYPATASTTASTSRPTAVAALTALTASALTQPAHLPITAVSDHARAPTCSVATVPVHTLELPPARGFGPDRLGRVEWLPHGSTCSATARDRSTGCPTPRSPRAAASTPTARSTATGLSLIHISEPTRPY